MDSPDYSLERLQQVVKHEISIANDRLATIDDVRVCLQNIVDQVASTVVHGSAEQLEEAYNHLPEIQEAIVDSAAFSGITRVNTGDERSFDLLTLVQAKIAEIRINLSYRRT